jgi:hypothetical protein
VSILWNSISAKKFDFGGSRCGSAEKWWNEKINKIERSQVCSSARATLKKYDLF